MKRNFGFTPYEGGGKYGFISYKSEDEKLVAPYAKALQDKGVKLWYDYGIPPGEDWFQTISQYIVESSFVILFITERVFRSSVIHIEIQTAEMWDIPVIPVFLESISRSSIPKGSASFYAKLALKQGVDRAWSMSVNETSKSIYELIAPIMASDTEEKIEQRGRLLERRTSLTPDVNNTPMVQSALSEVENEEKTEAKKTQESTSVQKPIQQPVQRPIQQPVQRPIQQPVQRPIQQPVQRPIQQPVQKPTNNLNSYDNKNINNTQKSKSIITPIAIVAISAFWIFVIFYLLVLSSNNKKISDTDNSNTSDLTSTTASSNITLTIGVYETDQEFIKSVTDKFSKKYVEEHDNIESVNIDVQLLDYNYQVDSDSLPDIFSIDSANLQESYLKKIYQVSDSLVSELKKSFGYSANGVRIGDAYYGYPYQINPAHVLVYDSSIYSSSEADDLNAILKKGKIGVYKQSRDEATWLFSAGGELFTNNDKSICTINSNQCVEMMRFVRQNSSKIIRFSDSNDMINTFKDGQISAMLLPPWEYRNFSGSITQNYGVSILPKVTVNGNSYRMKCFASTLFYAVNSSCKNPEIAIELLKFLTQSDNQISYCELTGNYPANSNTLQDSKIQTDPFAVACIKQMENVEFQSAYVTASGWWGEADTLFNGIYNGTISENQIQSELDALVTKLKENVA